MRRSSSTPNSLGRPHLRRSALAVSALAVAAGVTGGAVVLASPASAVICCDDTYIGVSPTVDIVADKTPVTVTWSNGSAGAISVDLCDASGLNGCVSVYSSDAVSGDGSVTRTIPGSINGQKCSDGTANPAIDCRLEVAGVGAWNTRLFPVSFKPAAPK